VRIVVVAGHVAIEQLREDGICPGRDVAALRQQTGTRGERELVGDLAARFATALRAKGHDAIATDASGGDDVRAPADLLVALHTQRDSRTSRAFAAAPDPAMDYVTADAAAAGQAWCDVFTRDYPRLSGIPTTPERANANLTNYYLWCYVHRDTACVLAELGNMDLDAAALFVPVVDGDPGPVVDALLTITERWSAPIPPPSPEPPPPPPVDLERARVLVRELTRVLEA
jgi:hypothetical protein